MDKLVVADVNSHMGCPLAAGTGFFEHDQVAGLELAHGNRSTVIQLGGGGAIDGDAKLLIDIAGKARAVKALGAAAAIHIGIPHEREGIIGDFLSLADLGGSQLCT